MQSVLLNLIALLLFATLGLFTRVRRLPYALLLFGATFGLLSMLYVVLQATWIGLVQLILYVGGLLILFSYGLMLSDRDRHGQWTSDAKHQPSAAWTLAGIGLWFALSTSTIALNGTPYPMPTLAQIGQMLLSEYALFFELIGLLLLVILLAVAALLKENQRT